MDFLSCTMCTWVQRVFHTCLKRQNTSPASGGSVPSFLLFCKNPNSQHPKTNQIEPEVGAVTSDLLCPHYSNYTSLPRQWFEFYSRQSYDSFLWRVWYIRTSESLFCFNDMIVINTAYQLDFHKGNK